MAVSFYEKVVYLEDIKFALSDKDYMYFVKYNLKPLILTCGKESIEKNISLKQCYLNYFKTLSIIDLCCALTFFKKYNLIDVYSYYHSERVYAKSKNNLTNLEILDAYEKELIVLEDLEEKISLRECLIVKAKKFCSELIDKEALQKLIHDINFAPHSLEFNVISSNVHNEMKSYILYLHFVLKYDLDIISLITRLNREYLDNLTLKYRDKFSNGKAKELVKYEVKN